MAHQSSRASAPPWQYSSSLGGEYIWNPQTDEIVMKTGERLARPRHLPRDSLRPARYEGALPVPFQYVGSPPNDSGYSLSSRSAQSSRPQPSGSSPRTGKSKTTRELGDAMNRMSITGGPPGGAPGRQHDSGSRSGDSRTPRPPRRIQVLSSGGEVEVTIEPLVRDPTSRKAAVRPQDTGYRVRIDNWAVLRSFFPLFRARTDAKSYFQVGCMFVVLRSGNAPASSIVTGLAPGTAINRRGQRVLAQARRFVVIQEGETYCYALPISTYGGRGVAQQGVTKSDHVIIFTTTNAPSSTASEAPQRGEAGMRPVPIRVRSSSPTNALDPMSRLDLGCVTLVQHNHQVQPFGNVCDRSVSDLKQQFENVWGDSRIPEPQVSQDEESSDDDDDDDAEAVDDDGNDDD